MGIGLLICNSDKCVLIKHERKVEGNGKRKSKEEEGREQTGQFRHQALSETQNIAKSSQPGIKRGTPRPGSVADAVPLFHLERRRHSI